MSPSPKASAVQTLVKLTVYCHTLRDEKVGGEASGGDVDLRQRALLTDVDLETDIGESSRQHRLGRLGPDALLAPGRGVVPSFAALRTYFEFDAEGGTDTFEEGLDFFFIDGVRARLARLER